MLSENHRRALATSLRVVERNLLDIIKDLAQKKTDGLLYRTINDVDSESREEILKAVNLMLDEISKIKYEFMLESRSQSLTGTINGRFGEVWVVLEDLQPEKLQNYGELSDQGKAILRPHISLLLKLLDDVWNRL